MYTYVPPWVINDKTRVDIEWRRGGAGVGDGGRGESRRVYGAASRHAGGEGKRDVDSV